MTNFGTCLINRYIAAIQWFIPLDVRHDAATLTRAQNVINAVVMAALSGPLYALVYAALGYSAAARVILTCCACMFAAPFLLRLTKSIVVAREVFLCAVFFNFSWLTYALGGVSAPTAGWMVVPPMVAMFLGGMATAMFWLCLTCAAVIFIYTLPLFGIPLPPNPVENMELLYLLCDVGLYLVIVLFVMLFELTKTEGFVKLQHALDFMKELATRDALTGSHSRRHALALIDDERENAGHENTTFSLCLLDIDYFKRINATHGHAAGDRVLREFALCVQKHLRPADSLGRYGGAQFLLMLPKTTQDEARAFAEGVRQSVQQLGFAMIAPELRITVSVGVAEFRPGESIGQTMARTEEAMYQASSSGRNRVAVYGQPPEPALSNAQGASNGLGAAPRMFDMTGIDELTGLLSRRVLRDRLGHAMVRALRNGRLVGLMLLNLNRFKEVNDSFGSDAGDSVLAQAAGHVRSCLDEADTVVRWSGDEFIVILEDLCAAQDMQRVAEKILDRFSFPLVVNERECLVSLSIGIAIFPAASCDMDALLKRADIAMTRARNLGDNNVQIYAPDAVLTPNERLTLKRHLREALASRQLLLEYQPQVDLATGQIVGVEALVRWAHPEYGQIEPDRFISLAEETGLIVPIGEWILRTACLQNVAWREAGLPPVKTAVNLSVRQLEHPVLAESILAIIKETGIDPQCLDLEIADGLLVDNMAPNKTGLGRLRSIGVRISIDDFGTGYSSLSRLSELPVDILKLDRSFVERLGQPDRNERAYSLAESIIDMAHRLHLTVIAEAVETEAQLADLRAMGCDAAQGFYFNRPAGPGRVAELLRQQMPTPSAGTSRAA